MTAARIIEDDHGTCSSRLHPHNGYYAGDFQTVRARRRTPSSVERVIRFPRHPDSEVLA